MNKLELLYSKSTHKNILSDIIPKKAIINTDEGTNIQSINVNLDKLTLKQKVDTLNAYIEEINSDIGVTYTTTEFDMTLNEMFKFINHRLEPVYNEEEEDGDVIVTPHKKQQERVYTILYYPYIDSETDSYNYVRPPVKKLIQNDIFERVGTSIVYYDTQNDSYIPVTEATSTINPQEIILSESYYVH